MLFRVTTAKRGQGVGHVGELINERWLPVDHRDCDAPYHVRTPRRLICTYRLRIVVPVVFHTPSPPAPLDSDLGASLSGGALNSTTVATRLRDDFPPFGFDTWRYSR